MPQLRRILTSIFLSLIFIATSQIAHASTWVPIRTNDRITFVPIAKLNAVEALPNQVGTQATLTLDGFGTTDAIYYQVQPFDASTASFDTTQAWQCHDKATLAANGNDLKLPLSNGRYKVLAAAVMVKRVCDISAYAAGNLIAGEVKTSNAFTLTHDTVLTEVANDVYIQQDNTTDTKGHLTSYDLQLKWPAANGVQHYLLTLYKDNIPFPFTVLPSDLQSDGSYLIEDTFDPTTYKFPAYTGAGDYRFDVQYCYTHR